MSDETKTQDQRDVDNAAATKEREQKKVAAIEARKAKEAEQTKVSKRTQILLNTIHMLKPRTFIEYPNGEVMARLGAYIWIDRSIDTVAGWMKGQWHKVRSIRVSELKEGVEVAGFDARHLALLDKEGIKIPKWVGQGTVKSTQKRASKPAQPAAPTSGAPTAS